MKRRDFIAVMLLLVASTVEAAPPKKFHFRVKTKAGSIVGNVLIEAPDIEAAKVKLYKRYPGCMILNVK